MNTGKSNTLHLRFSQAKVPQFMGEFKVLLRSADNESVKLAFKPRKFMVAVKTLIPHKLVPQRIKPAVATQPDIHLKIEPGHLLFSKGDPGGDLYFIEKGTVQIFIVQKDQEIILTEMGVGEAIGVMTLLTLEPRLASARAKDLVVVKKISKAAIARLITVLPKWLHIVLKEFTGRIVEMNRLYSETMVDLKKCRESQMNPLTIAAQFAPTASLLAVGRKDDSDSVFVADLLGQLMIALNQPKEMINNIWKVFVTTGCVKIKVDPVKKQPAVLVAELGTLSTFTNFLRDSTKGPTRKIMRAKFTIYELNLLTEMAEATLNYAKSSEVTVSYKASDIIAELLKTNKAPWNVATIEKAAKSGMVVTKGSGDNLVISYSPSVLLTTLGFISAIKIFSGDVDQNPAPDAAAPPPEPEAPSQKASTLGTTPAA